MSASLSLATVTAEDLIGLTLEELEIFSAQFANGLAAGELTAERGATINRAIDKAIAAERKALKAMRAKTG